MRGSSVVFGILLMGFSVLTAANTPTIIQDTPQESQKMFCGEKNLRDDIDFIIAPIKSKDDLQTFLNIHHKQPTPLDYLSSAARTRFLDSLTFNEKGVTGFTTADIESELTVTEAYQLLALVGAQRVIENMEGLRVEDDMDAGIMSIVRERQTNNPRSKAGCGTDYKDYKCEGLHTCTRSLSGICLSTC